MTVPDVTTEGRCLHSASGASHLELHCALLGLGVGDLGRRCSGEEEEVKLVLLQVFLSTYRAAGPHGSQVSWGPA